MRRYRHIYKIYKAIIFLVDIHVSGIVSSVYVYVNLVGGVGVNHEKFIVTKGEGTGMGKGNYNWSEIARNPKYLELKRRKRVFLFGWWIAASAYYFSLPLLAGYFPALFKIKLIGVINFGYLFILSQFLVAIFVAMYYTKVANRDFDRLTAELVQEIQ